MSLPPTPPNYVLMLLASQTSPPPPSLLPTPTSPLTSSSSSSSTSSSTSTSTSVSTILEIPTYASLIQPLSKKYRTLSLDLMEKNLSTFDSYLSSFSQSLTSLTSPALLPSDQSNPIIQPSKAGKTSMYGVFVRRTVLGMEKLDFQQLVRSYEVTKEYWRESKDEASKMVGIVVASDNMMDVDEDDEAEAEEDVMKIINRKVRRSKGERFGMIDEEKESKEAVKASSLPTLSLLSSTSLPPLLLSKCMSISSTIGRFPPSQTSHTVSTLSTLYPTSSLVHYLNYLNSLLHSNPSSAEEALHRYSDVKGLREGGCYAMGVMWDVMGKRGRGREFREEGIRVNQVMGTGKGGFDVGVCGLGSSSVGIDGVGYGSNDAYNALRRATVWEGRGETGKGRRVADRVVKMGVESINSTEWILANWKKAEDGVEMGIKGREGDENVWEEVERTFNKLMDVYKEGEDVMVLSSAVGWCKAERGRMRGDRNEEVEGLRMMRATGRKTGGRRGEMKYLMKQADYLNRIGLESQAREVAGAGMRMAEREQEEGTRFKRDFLVLTGRVWEGVREGEKVGGEDTGRRIMAEHVLGMGYWKRGKVILKGGERKNVGVDTHGEEIAKKYLVMGKATFGSIGDAEGEEGVEKRKRVAIGYLERAMKEYERIDGREGVKETAYLMALLGVEGVAEKWASL